MTIDEGGAFAHANHAKATPVRRTRIETHPVVDHAEHDLAIAALNHDIYLRGTRVLVHVVQGLLRDAVEIDFDIRREPAIGEPNALKARGYPIRTREQRHEIGERRLEAERL
jgi:hypothetical protein